MAKSQIREKRTTRRTRRSCRSCRSRPTRQTGRSCRSRQTRRRMRSSSSTVTRKKNKRILTRGGNNDEDTKEQEETEDQEETKDQGEKIQCCMCEKQVSKSNTLIPSSCFRIYLGRSHRICKQCWWDPVSGFARETGPHECPGCEKGLPLPYDKYTGIVDLTDEDDKI